jgi:hypothetical protein
MVDQARSGLQMRGRKRTLEGAFILILGAGIGLSGPYGTFDALSIEARLLYWTAMLFVPWSIWRGLNASVVHFAPDTVSPHLMTALLMPGFAIIGSAFGVMMGDVFGLNPTETTFLGAWPMALLGWLSFSFLIVLPLLVLGDEISRTDEREGATKAIDLLKRKLPSELQISPLIAIKAEDHYVRVYTEAGETLILMSFEDALIAVAGYPGVQTHRSWWLALDQIMASNTSGQLGTSITLKQGLAVPVSRRRKKAVRSALARIGD